MRTKDKGQIDGFYVGVIIAVILVVGVIIGLTVWVGGTWSKTDTSSMGCVYNGGPLDDNNFTAYTKPGTGRTYQGFASDVTYVPIGLRQYRVSLDPEQGDTPAPDSVKVRVKGYDMVFEPTVPFTINTEVIDGKPKACTFIERQLRPFGATDFNTQGGHWQFDFLNERFRPILNDVATRVLQTFDPGALKFNTDGARDKAAEQIGVNLKKQLDATLGDNYFCDSSYQFGQGSDACGTGFAVILPAPTLSADDEAQLAKPQRAKIDADNDIAAAGESARKAQQVANAKATEADAAKTLADANDKINTENARVTASQAINTYAWCAYLVSLNQNCALVKAAENSNFPNVILGDASQAVVPVGTAG